jgi:hypothetical protein
VDRVGEVLRPQERAAFRRPGVIRQQRSQQRLLRLNSHGQTRAGGAPKSGVASATKGHLGEVCQLPQYGNARFNLQADVSLVQVRFIEQLVDSGNEMRPLNIELDGGQWRLPAGLGDFGDLY